VGGRRRRARRRARGHHRRGMKGAIAASLALVAAIAVGVVEAEPRSGIDYAGADVRAMQADDAKNPGMLWVERGAALWRDGAAACASCHGDAAASMKGVAAPFSGWSVSETRVLDLEDRINACRVERQGRSALARESEDLNALTAYVATQSRGVPVDVNVDGAARAAFERARAFYHERRGQLNFACANCHEQNAG